MSSISRTCSKCESGVPATGRSNGNLPSLIHRFCGFIEASNRRSTLRTDSKYSSSRAWSPLLPFARNARACSRTKSSTEVSSRCNEPSISGDCGFNPEITACRLFRNNRSNANCGTISFGTGVFGSAHDKNEPSARGNPPPAVSIPVRGASIPNSSEGSGVWWPIRCATI